MMSYSCVFVTMISSVVHATQPSEGSRSGVCPPSLGLRRRSRRGMSCTPTEKREGRRRRFSVSGANRSVSRGDMLERTERL